MKNNQTLLLILGLVVVVAVSAYVIVGGEREESFGGGLGGLSTGVSANGVGCKSNEDCPLDKNTGQKGTCLRGYCQTDAWWPSTGYCQCDDGTIRHKNDDDDNCDQLCKDVTPTSGDRSRSEGGVNPGGGGL